MKITNRNNLPLPLVAAVTNDSYTSGGADYSVTTLIKPAKAVAIERLHKDDITEDASDRIWSLMGQIGHTILERAAMEELAEHRFFVRRLGKLIGGQLDLWKSEDLLDYKFTSAWAVKDGVKPEWEQQMNLNALLCRENGVNVKKAQIVAILRDWSKLEAKRDVNYPRFQVLVLDVKMWSPAEQEGYLTLRLAEHIAASEGRMPECSAYDRWEKPAVFAVMKAGRKSAVKLHNTKEPADSMAQSMGGWVVHRPGQNVRCENYCNAAPFCPTFKKLKEENAKTETHNQDMPELPEGGDGKLPLS